MKGMLWWLLRLPIDQRIGYRSRYDSEFAVVMYWPSGWLKRMRALVSAWAALRKAGYETHAVEWDAFLSNRFDGNRRLLRLRMFARSIA